MTTPGVAEAVRRLDTEVAHIKTVQRRLEALLGQGVVVNRRAGNALEWQRKARCEWHRRESRRHDGFR
jgi:hypothetical protein